MLKKIAFLGCILVKGWGIHAQQVSVLGVSEQRASENSYFGNTCEVRLLVEGMETKTFKLVKIAKINKAEDDLGTNLINEEESNEFKYEEINEVAELGMKLSVAPRKATKIRELSGELVFFGPTEDNGGIIKVSNYQTQVNKNLVSDKHDLIVMYLTRASLKQYADANKQLKEDDLNKMPEKQRLITETLLDAARSTYDFGDEENQAMFIVEGDYERFVDLYFEDVSGTKIDRNGYMKVGGFYTYYYEQPPAKDWKLVIQMETPGSVKMVPFSLKDIILP
jgi:hypothetical protein